MVEAHVGFVDVVGIIPVAPRMQHSSSTPEILDINLAALSRQIDESDSSSRSTSPLLDSTRLTRIIDSTPNSRSVSPSSDRSTGDTRLTRRRRGSLPNFLPPSSHNENSLSQTSPQLPIRKRKSFSSTTEIEIAVKSTGFNNEEIFSNPDFIREFTKCEDLEIIDLDNTKIDSKNNPIVKFLLDHNGPELALVNDKKHYSVLCKKTNGEMLLLDSGEIANRVKTWYKEDPDNYKHTILESVKEEEKLSLNDFYYNNLRIQHDQISCLSFSLMFIKKITTHQNLIERILDKGQTRAMDIPSLGNFKIVASLPEEFVKYAQSTQLLRRFSVESRDDLIATPRSGDCTDTKEQNRSIDILKLDIMEQFEEFLTFKQFRNLFATNEKQKKLEQRSQSMLY